MTETPDIEALVAEELNREKAVLGFSWSPENSISYRILERIQNLTDALEAQQAVVEALGKADKRAIRWRTSGPHNDVVEIYFEVAGGGAQEFCEALADVDAPPEGEGTKRKEDAGGLT